MKAQILCSFFECTQMWSAPGLNLGMVVDTGMKATHLNFDSLEVSSRGRWSVCLPPQSPSPVFLRGGSLPPKAGLTQFGKGHLKWALTADIVTFGVFLYKGLFCFSRLSIRRVHFSFRFLVVSPV